MCSSKLAAVTLAPGTRALMASVDRARVIVVYASRDF